MTCWWVNYHDMFFWKWPTPLSTCGTWFIHYSAKCFWWGNSVVTVVAWRTHLTPVVVARYSPSLRYPGAKGGVRCFYHPSPARSSQRFGGEFMGRVAAPCSGPGRIVSFLTAVPCLSCKQQQRRRRHQSAAAERGTRRRMSEQGKSAASTPSSGTPVPGSDTYKGWLFKWTNYIKGYQRRWFVLSNGLLSYYRYHGSSHKHVMQLFLYNYHF